MEDFSTPWYRTADPVTAMVSARFGRLLAIASEAVVYWVDTLTRTILAEYSETDHPVQQIAAASDGSLLAIARRASGVQVIDPIAQKIVHTYMQYTGAVSALVFSPDGRYLASASVPRRLWGRSGLARLSSHKQSIIKVWEARTGKDRFLYSGHDRNVFGLAWSPDGNYLASGGDDDYIAVWHSQTGYPLVSYAGHRHRISMLAFSPDGEKIASVSLDKTLQVWSPWHPSSSAPKRIEHRPGREELLAVAWSPDGKLLAVGGRDGGVQVVDGCARPVFREKAHQQAVSALAWSFDAQLYSASEDRTVRVWQMPIETPDLANR